MTNNKICSLFLFLAIALAACASPEKLTTNTISDNIIGEWRHTSGDTQADFVLWFIFKGEGANSSNGQCLSSKGNGTWKLANNKLHIVIIDSENPLLNMDATYQILSLDKHTLVLKNTEDTETFTLKRTAS